MRSFVMKHSLRWMAVVALLFGAAQSAFAQSSIEVIVHSVEGKPAQGQVGYDVTAYVSVLDGAKNPIGDLQIGDFSVFEDSKPVQLLSADLAAEDPINLVLALDASGSMSGPGIEAARSAAAKFLSRLGPQDRVAVYAFSETPELIVDFTTDHANAAAQLQLVSAVPGAGTCLYDAAYEAVQKAATATSGRRAIILFTDGKDELADGRTCSTHTLEEVIALAQADGTRVPIYTLGLGNQVDQETLRRMSRETGGRFVHAPDVDQLEADFLIIAEALRTQYALRYFSTAGHGSHTLTVTVTVPGDQGIGTRNFTLPELPPSLVPTATLASPAAATLTLTPTPTATATITPTSTPTSPFSGEKGALNLIVLLVVGVVGLFLLGLLIFLIVVLRRRREQHLRDLEWARQVGGVGEPPTPIAVPVPDRTIDSWEVSPDALGMFVVIASDDASMINHRFEIIKSHTTLGRSADNDLPFPKDSP
ncbi:MAG: VWA domain-containing protein, partial [Chloroflexota bacterium]